MAYRPSIFPYEMPPKSATLPFRTALNLRWNLELINNIRLKKLPKNAIKQASIYIFFSLIQRRRDAIFHSVFFSVHPGRPQPVSSACILRNACARQVPSPQGTMALTSDNRREDCKRVGFARAIMRFCWPRSRSPRWFFASSMTRPSSSSAGKDDGCVTDWSFQVSFPRNASCSILRPPTRVGLSRGARD